MPPPRRLSNRPGIVSQAEIKAYPYTLIRALSTERYAVTPELSGSEGKGDCGVTLHGPAREFPVFAFGGVSCATAVRVIGLWSINEGRRDESGLCYQDLCTRLFPSYLGFFCKTTIVGDASWVTTCRGGAGTVVTNAAD